MRPLRLHVASSPVGRGPSYCGQLRRISGCTTPRARIATSDLGDVVMMPADDGYSCNHLEPSRRDVVKGGTAAAISAATIPIDRAFAAEGAS